MNSDDEKRLTEIRARDALWTKDRALTDDTWSLAITDRHYALAKLDESERARKAATHLLDLAKACYAFEKERADAQRELTTIAEVALAEEYTKARTLVEQNVAQGRDRDEWRKRAEKAEAALAEERAKWGETALSLGSFRVAADYHGTPTLWCIECKRDSGFHWAKCSKAKNETQRRAEAAEARVRELEAAIQCGGKTPAEGG